MPRVTEANALSKELKRDINFETKVTSVMHKTEGMTSLVMVKVRNTCVANALLTTVVLLMCC